MKVIGVRFKSTKKIYYFNPNGFEINKNDNVIVETSRGIEFGQVVIGIKDVPESEIVQPLQNVIRIATEEDVRTLETNIEKQKEAYEKCLQKIEKHELDMKLVDAEYTFDGTKLIFYFTSDGRVDFRELVKDLAVLFKTRIELRQIAVRDETKMLGGLGPCGNEICCKRFLGDFASVSIKMAKEQNLSLNPTKISGLCGRLICCLNYEKDFYEEMNKKLPALDEVIQCVKGEAQVVATYPLKESIKVKYTNPDGSTDTTVFHLNDITRLDGEKIKVQAAEDSSSEAIDDELKMLVAEADSSDEAVQSHESGHTNHAKKSHHNHHQKNDKDKGEYSSKPDKQKHNRHMSETQTASETKPDAKNGAENTDAQVNPVASQQNKPNHKRRHHRNHHRDSQSSDDKQQNEHIEAKTSAVKSPDSTPAQSDAAKDNAKKEHPRHHRHNRRRPNNANRNSNQGEQKQEQ